MKIKTRRFISICLVLILSGIIFQPLSVHAASKAAKARETYKKLLKSESKLGRLSPWNTDVSWSNAKYTTIDINKDGIPELLVRSDDGIYTMLIAYINGKAKCIGQTPEGTTSGTGSIAIYPSRKVICLTTCHNWKNQTFYKFNGKKLEEKCRAWKLDNHESYDINGSAVSKEKFEEYKAKLLKNTKQSKIKLKKNKTSKKSKKAFYSGSGYNFANFAGRKDSISKVSCTKKQVTIKGALTKASSKTSSFEGKGPLLKNKSRTFKLAANCKYYYTDGKGRRKLSRDKFFRTVNSDYSFTGFYFYTNNNGEIYRMEADYSL